MAEPIGTALAELAVKKVVGKGYEAINKYVIDFESNRETLQNTINRIEAALLDGEQYIDQHTREELSVLIDRWLDFSDKRACIEQSKQVMSGGNFTKEFLSFFSPSNQLVSRIKAARKLDDINKKLSSIALDRAMINHICCIPTQTRSIQRLGSSSNILTNYFVGRDKDRDHMLSMLSEDTLALGTLSVDSVVGIGGMGKTSLAWSVYNDDKMEHCFDVRFWVSMTQDFDVTKVLQKIISCVAGEVSLNLCDKEQLYHHFERAIRGKKFLLVLDNIWGQTDLRNKWFDLRKLLEFGANGSKVLITTRDLKVARVMDSNAPYTLDYLTKDDSWLLFQNIAFTHQRQEPGVEAVGMEIAEMCIKVPLVIRSIAGHLAGKSTLQEWQAFKDDQLANFASYGHDVMHTLKFSYDQLDTTQKLCVNYCSLFQKGVLFSKDVMIHRWMALDYVKPKFENQSLEDAGTECMISLVNSGFLQLFSREVIFAKMHDVMYELVLTVAGFKYKVMESNTVEIDERVRHLSFWKAGMTVSNEDYWEVPSSLFKIKHLQSFVRGSARFTNDLKVTNMSLCGKLISKFESLRVLDLGGVGIKELPTSVGDLICLRFLNLYGAKIMKVPNSITRLVKLQTLYLDYCEKLEELQRDMRKLVNLRHLVLRGSRRLRHMPMGLGNLTELRTLDTFIVGEQFESKAGRLVDLDKLNNLSGRLEIELRRESMLGESSGTYLKMKEKLRELVINFKKGTKEDERVLECLQPPPNLERLEIKGYGGERLASWMMDSLHNHLPWLTYIKIVDCKSCKYMCSFGRLPHLEYLYLSELDEVEYVEDINELSQMEGPLFPSLIQLQVRGMPKLKGWRRMYSKQEDQHQHQHVVVSWKPPSPFPKLYALEVDSVELANAISRNQIGGFTSLLKLYIRGNLRIGEECDEQQAHTFPLWSSCFPNLIYLRIRGLKRVEFLPEGIRYLSSLQTLSIERLENMKAIPEWIDSLTSLQELYLQNCPTLESLPHQIINLPNLNTLDIYECPELREKCQRPHGEYWPFIQHIPHLYIQ